MWELRLQKVRRERTDGFVSKTYDNDSNLIPICLRMENLTIDLKTVLGSDKKELLS